MNVEQLVVTPSYERQAKPREPDWSRLWLRQIFSTATPTLQEIVARPFEKVLAFNLRGNRFCTHLPSNQALLKASFGHSLLPDENINHGTNLFFGADLGGELIHQHFLAVTTIKVIS